jgi:outer membrane protein TolC
MWRAGLSLSLPLRRGRLDAGVAEAEARRRSAEARRQALQADLALFVRQRLLALRAVERSVTVYEQGLLPQGQLSVEAAVASYQAGKAPFVTVLEAQTSLYADRSTLLRLRAGHATLRAGLEEIQVEASDLPSPEPASVAGSGPTGTAMSMGR